MSEKLVPRIRFDGFDGEWEQTTLGDVAALNPPGQLPETFEYVDLASVVGTALVGHRTESRTSAPSRAQRLARPGDVFYQTVRPYQRNNYLFRGARHPYVFSTGYAQLRPTVDSEFLFTAIHRDEFVLGVLDHCTGTSYPAIAPSDLAEMPVSAPVFRREQQAIGTLFADLDAVIDQHRRRHQQLKQIRASLIERMFPAPGETVPQIRFDGFGDEWVESEVGSLGVFLKGSGYSKADVGLGRTPLFLYGRLYTNYQLAVEKVSTFASPRPNSVVSRGNEVLVPSSGETPDDIAVACALLEPGVLIGGDLNVVRPTSQTDPIFLALSLSHGVAKDALSKRAQGKSVVHLHNSDLRALTIHLPSSSEQRAIGAFFAKLDALIEAEQHRVEKLQQTKASLLQKMFV